MTMSIGVIGVILFLFLALTYKVNWRKFAFLFGLSQAALFLVGCTAAWLSAVSSMLPSLEAAVAALVTFVLSLEGKTVSPTLSATIKKIGDDIAAEIANVQTLIADFKANASTGYLSQIQAVFQGIISNLGSILSAASVSDTATVSKITQFVGLAVAAAQAILALLPLAIHKMQSGASMAELQREDKVGALAVNNADKALKETYVAILADKTENVAVNEALDALPRSI